MGTGSQHQQETVGEVGRIQAPTVEPIPPFLYAEVQVIGAYAAVSEGVRGDPTGHRLQEMSMPPGFRVLETQSRRNHATHLDSLQHSGLGVYPVLNLPDF